MNNINQTLLSAVLLMALLFLVLKSYSEILSFGTYECSFISMLWEDHLLEDIQNKYTDIIIVEDKDTPTMMTICGK